MSFENVEDYKRLYDFNYVTFLNKESIDLRIRGLWKNYRKRKIQKFIDNYIHQDTNISVILINKTERQEIKNDKSYSFDGTQEPQTNKLYYKFNTGNDLHEYFTYDKYLLKKEEYNISLMKRLTSRLGLKKIKIDNETRHNMIYKYGKDSKFILNIEKLNIIELGLNKEEESDEKTSRRLKSTNLLENHGCEIFFKSFRYRDFWCEKFYNKDKMLQADLVKTILLDQKYFTYECYQNNQDIISILDQRLNGTESITYNLTESEYESSIIKKFIKLDLKIRKYFGIDISNEVSNYNNNEKYINKTLEIIFHEIRDLELETVKREIKRLKSKIDTSLLNENVNFRLVNKSLKNICQQLDTLKSGLERCRELDKNITNEKKYEYSNSFGSIEDLFKKIKEATDNRDYILKRRMSDVIDEMSKVQHNGDWCRDGGGLPRWSCCNSRYYYSSCTNTERRMYYRTPRKDFIQSSNISPISETDTVDFNDENKSLESTSYKSVSSFENPEKERHSPESLKKKSDSFFINEIKTMNQEEVSTLFLDKYGNSDKYPGMVFETTYISGYNVNNDTMGTSQYVVKRVK